jgi:hypothetical protein
MKKVVRQYPGRELHVILDNSSTHSTPDAGLWDALFSGIAEEIHRLGLRDASRGKGRDNGDARPAAVELRLVASFPR